MIRARRPEDPRNYVLVEELCVSSIDPAKTRASRRVSGRSERRVLADSENVYEAQMQWKSDMGMLTLMERDRVHEVRVCHWV